VISNIQKLKILTETLVDRDYIRSKILSLFNSFCEDFPIPLNVWITDKDLNILSKNGEIRKNKKHRENICEIFEGATREKNIKMHKLCATGERVTYIIKNNKNIFLTRLVPAAGDKNMIFGISMEISSFVNMAEALESHCNDFENNKCDLLKDVKNDPLYMIIKEEGV
tara:strand:+ start:341 stop:844 length:504 start_codon:yes stop_codon:yes gene_type:complete